MTKAIKMKKDVFHAAITENTRAVFHRSVIRRADLV